MRWWALAEPASRGLAKFDNHDSKIEPDLRPIGSLRAADQICHLWQRYTSTAILPLAGTNAAIRREISSFNSLNVVRMEGKINAVIQRSIDSACSACSIRRHPADSQASSLG